MEVSKISIPDEIIIKAIFSNPKIKSVPKKVLIKKVVQKSNSFYVKESQSDNKMFTESFDENSLTEKIEKLISENEYKNIDFYTEKSEYQYLVSKKGKISLIKRASKTENIISGHNREKNYLIPEGSDAPFLRDLGVFTDSGKIVNSMYDKFKQINRFTEILDHSFKNTDKKEITILDFGCGKSYLTFVIYYYFVKIRKIKAKIIGYDLKKDVVDNCNNLASKYGYNGLTFVVADVTKDTLTDVIPDMVISLHACDTATDAALKFAADKNAEFIFSVPCCQHEINQTISANGDFDILLKSGLIKERFSALLTDSIRMEILKRIGYEVDALEFVDYSHSPKNIMIRARKKSHTVKPDFSDLCQLEKKYSFKQTLLDEMEKQNGKQ